MHMAGDRTPFFQVNGLPLLCFSMGNEEIAKHGEKTIEVSLRFWTDDIAETKGHIEPRHCWSAGTVRIPKNDSHGISGEYRAIPFNSLKEITSAIEKAMTEADITIHTDPARG